MKLSEDEQRAADLLLVGIIREIIHAKAGEAVALTALAEAAACLLVGGGHDLRVFWEQQLGRAAEEVAAGGVGNRGAG